MSYGLPRIGVVLIAMLVAVASVSADNTPATQPATTLPAIPDGTKLFSELASEDQATRESARSALMKLTRDDLPALREIVVHSSPMRPAQAVAMHDIIQEIFLAGEQYPTLYSVRGIDRATGDSTRIDIEAPSVQKAIELVSPKLKEIKANEVKPTTGFLGILMDDGSRIDSGADNDGDHPIGVVVADRIPGFCASRSLHDGDIILGVAAPFTPFRSRIDLTNAIGNLPPGTVVQLLALRRGQVTMVTLTLDPRPAQQLLIDDNGALFRGDRQRRFELYWQANFKPLISQQLG